MSDEAKYKAWRTACAVRVLGSVAASLCAGQGRAADLTVAMIDLLL